MKDAGDVAVDGSEPTADRTDDPPPPPATLDERVPGGTLAFVLALPVAVLGYAWRTRGHWFYGDEWVFITLRDGADIDSLLVAHNEHLSVVPAILWRAMFNVFGLHVYRPYQAMSMAAHLLVVVLLWKIVRRQGLSPWIATISASVLLFFGPGSQNATWAFQVGFTGGIAGALACLLVADVDDPSPRRILAAMVCGALGILSAGTGVIVLAVVLTGLALRRGPRTSIIIAAPLYLGYLWWWQNYQFDPRPAEDATVRQSLAFLRRGLTEVAWSLTFSRWIGLFVLAALLVGLVLAVRRNPSLASIRARFAVPITMAAGAVGFLLATSRGRAVSYGVQYASSGRFQYTVVALCVPVLALALAELFRRHWIAGVVVAGLLAVSMPLNLRHAGVRRHLGVTPGALYFAGTDPSVQSLPPDTKVFPDHFAINTVRTGWLARTIEKGQFPDDVTVTSSDRAEIIGRLLIEREVSPIGPECPPVPEDVVVDLAGADEIVSFGTIRFRTVMPDGAESKTLETASLTWRVWRLRGDHEAAIRVVSTGEFASVRRCPPA